MSLYFETLQYVDADNATQEIALRLANLAGYGAVKCVFNPRSHAPGTFQITWAVAPETGIAIPFKSRCIVYAGRTRACSPALITPPRRPRSISAIART